MLETLAPLINDVHFNVDPQPDSRYFTNNPSYGLGDGSILQAFLRHLRPQRYLEVGSGWTTALALDTNDRWLNGRLRLTCIEPYPDDLRRLVRPGDDVEIIVSPGAGRRPRRASRTSSRATSCSSTAHTSSRRAAMPITW